MTLTLFSNEVFWSTRCSFCAFFTQFVNYAHLTSVQCADGIANNIKLSILAARIDCGKSSDFFAIFHSLDLYWLRAASAKWENLFNSSIHASGVDNSIFLNIFNNKFLCAAGRHKIFENQCIAHSTSITAAAKNVEKN